MFFHPERSNNKPFGQKHLCIALCCSLHLSLDRSGVILVMTLSFLPSLPSESGNWQLEHLIKLLMSSEKMAVVFFVFLVFHSFEHVRYLKIKLHSTKCHCVSKTPGGSLSRKAETIDPLTTATLIITD